MKKSPSHYLLLTTYYLLGLTPLVRAGPVDGVYQLTDGLQQIIHILIQFISETILQINSFDESLFAKILLFVIIMLIIYTVLKNNSILGDNRTIIWIISISISILAIRFIPSDLVEFILLQYGVLGTSLTIFFPFIIFLFFLHQSDIGPMPRKIGWIFFGISYIAIWSFRQGSISGILEYLYWGGILAALIAYLFDRQIHAQIGKMEQQKKRKAHESEKYADIEEKIRDIDSQLTNGNLPFTIRKNLERRREYFYKELNKIMKSL